MMQDARIVFVSHTAEPGGAELALARYLKGSKSHNVLVTLQQGQLWEELELSGVEVRNIEPMRGDLFQTLRALRRELKALTPGVVVANSMRAAFYCALVKPAGVRMAYWVRDGLRQSAMSALNLFLTTHITLMRTDACIANSEWTADTVRKIRDDLPVSVVPSPCGLRSGGNLSARSGPLVEGRIELLYLGRLSRWKGVHLAISALAKIRSTSPAIDYRLTIAGGALFAEQEYEAELRKQVKALGISDVVTFVGHTENVEELFATHDMLVHCSTVPEPFGQVVVQAMGYGLAVVAANAGGPKEIITSGRDGLLYPMGDDDELVAAVRHVVDNELLASLSTGALLTAASYSDERIIALIDSQLSRLQLRPERSSGSIKQQGK